VVSNLATVTALFEAQAARTPNRVALRVGHKVLTYEWLNKRANQLSHRLRMAGVGPEKVVSVCLRRDERLVVALIAILKAGGAYLPLDGDYPTERLAFMHGNAGAMGILTENQFLGISARLGGVLVNLDEENLKDYPGSNGSEQPGLSELAYVIYTSGSTGRPKGVMVEHRSLANYLFLAAGETRVTEHDCVPQIVSQSFDPSIREMLSPLLVGGCLLMLPDRSQRTPEALADIFASGQVTAVLAVVPSLLTEILAVAEETGRQWPLRLVATAGEPLTNDLATRLRQRADGGIIVNQYGPTECTMVSARWTYDPASARDGVLPIGKPIANVAITLRDAMGRTVPDGEVGEICISGAGVSRGYTGDRKRASSSFLPPSTDSPRSYRTGDLARLLPDGNLLFLGRLDRQVKIRGVRIEPAEIESALRHLPLIRNAAVSTHDDRGAPRLVAYITTHGSQAPALEILREALLATLPREMVPAEYRWVEDFPLTLSGKIDRARLSPSLGNQLRASPPGARQPFTGLAHDIVAIWRDVLDAREIPPDGRFLDLGGDSLLAARVASRIRKQLGLEITSAVLFGNPTVEEVADLLASLGATPTDSPPDPSTATGRPGLVPLSSAQRRLWLIDQMAAPEGLYNQPVALRVRGSLDVPALNKALQELVSRHEALRTVIGTVAGSPHQVVLPPSQADIAIESRPTPGTPATSQELQRLALRGFDLSAELPIRAFLVPEARQSSVLLLVVHHIVTDAWSRELLLRDLFELYRCQCAGSQPTLPPARAHYADYALWEEWHCRPGSAAFDREREFWQRELAGIPSALELPASRPRPPSPSFLGDHVTLELDGALLAALQRLARQEKATLFMVLHAAVAGLLARMGAGTDIPIGTPVSNRPDERFEQVIGFFANTIVLRTDVSGRPSFRELLSRVRRANSVAYDHQSFPFDQLVTDLNPLRSASINPLFQVLITFEQAMAPPTDVPGLSFEAVPVHLPRAKFDLTFGFTVSAGADANLVATIEFNTDLFDPPAVRELADRLRLLLLAVTQAPDAPITEAKILTSNDQAVIGDVQRGPTARQPPADVVELVRAHAKRRPSAIAVRYEGSEITYEEMMRQSGGLAELLRGRGVGPESIVAVALPRSIDLAVTLLAILQAGAAYMPIDLTYPVTRIAAMLEDARPACVITHRQGLLDLPRIVHYPLIDITDPVVQDHMRALAADITGGGPLEEHSSPARAGYVVFTSGSTGRPKGIVMPMAGLANLIQWHAATLSDINRNYIAQFTSLGFDVAIQELLAPLATGRCLILPTDDIRRDIPKFVDWLAKYEINELHGPMSALQVVLETAADRADKLPHLTALFQAGEAFTNTHHIQLFARNRTVYNLYGPAETHVVSGYRVPVDTDAASSSVPIGRPIDSSISYLLDSDLRPAPLGAVGEIYLGGAQLARGYLHQPGLTASRFVADPFLADGSRMYRTGDLGRIRPDGELQFIGRADDQVKIRGFRIELREIEATLIRHPKVAQAAAVAANGRISAYVSAATGHHPSSSELREFIGNELPGYMIPASITITDALPHSPNGKLDRRALLALERSSPPVIAPPKSSAEELICEIFSEVLELSNVQPHDSFFDLGGHSIAAARLLSRLRHVFDAELTIRDIFEAPSAALLSTRLDVSRESISGAEYATLLPLRANGLLEPLFCVHPGIGLSWTYSALLRHLEADRPVYGLQAPAFTGGSAPQGIHQLAMVYTEQILALKPRGMFHLIGWSYGGLVAQAIAADLRRRGHRVGFLGLLDAYPNDITDHHTGQGPRPTRSEIFSQLLASLGCEAGDGDVTFSGLVELLRSADGPLAGIPAVRIPAVIRVFSDHVRHMADYLPPVLNGDLTVWRAAIDTRGRPLPSRSDQWRPFATGIVTEFPVKISHGRMGLAEGLTLIGPQIADLIADHER
jgi:amino acid adenylation domain-containing protein